MNHFFTHPSYLALLIFIPVLILAYHIIRGKVGRNEGIVHVNTEALDRVIPSKPLRRTLIAPICALLAALALIFALAGPVGNNKRAHHKATIVLVIDTSISMLATDVKPSRIEAAKTAAKNFIRQLDPGINIGLISFNQVATTEAEPTLDHGKVVAAIDQLQLNTYTATGRGIQSALDMISTFNEHVGGESIGNNTKDAGTASPGTIVLESDGKETVPEFPTMPGGEYVVAQKAKQMNIPINTISFGTPQGTLMRDGENVPVPVDDASLAKVAKLSGGKAFTARNMHELQSVYSSLSHEVSVRTERDEDPTIALVIAALAILGMIIAKALAEVKTT